mmetsp:Transcript_14747/g.46288  ORF Transcript_14747/g.46288 Transcript_14747/m.46288 type:complete len:370 (+) Transcript_14747:189-1298(+)
MRMSRGARRCSVADLATVDRIWAASRKDSEAASMRDAKMGGGLRMSPCAGSITRKCRMPSIQSFIHSADRCSASSTKIAACIRSCFLVAGERVGAALISSAAPASCGSTDAPCRSPKSLARNDSSKYDRASRTFCTRCLVDGSYVIPRMKVVSPRPARISNESGIEPNPSEKATRLASRARRIDARRAPRIEVGAPSKTGRIRAADRSSSETVPGAAASIGVPKRMRDFASSSESCASAMCMMPMCLTRRPASSTSDDDTNRGNDPTADSAKGECTPSGVLAVGVDRRNPPWRYHSWSSEEMSVSRSCGTIDTFNRCSSRVTTAPGKQASRRSAMSARWSGSVCCEHAGLSACALNLVRTRVRTDGPNS